MSQRTRIHSAGGRRFLALALAAALPAAAIPAQAAEVIGNGVAPTYDEAYYATLDYYGNLTEGSVVKSYALNGISSFTDYGTYDDVVNLTDGTVPASKDGTTTFQFSGESAPKHFYFEGKTTQPFESLPWTLSMSYALNGVPAKAEDLAGKTGVVSIHLDIVPNENASEYAKNNYTLEAMSVFNQDDILSLKAEGAQVQLVGNLRAVLFLALPGEEQHFTIEVGTEDFSFDGMTFLMVPATLSQLDQIADLSTRKDELEDNYEKLNKSFDTTLDAMNSMTGSLYATAKGLDELNQGRETISAGKGTIYEGIDASLVDVESIAKLLDPMAEQVQAASQTLTDSKDILKTLTDVGVSLKTELSQTRNALDNLEHDSKKLKDLSTDMKNLSGSLDRLESALRNISSISTGGSSTSVGDMPTLIPKLHDAYAGGAKVTGGKGDETNLNDAAFVAALALAGGKDATAAGALAAALSDDTSPYHEAAMQLHGLHQKAGSDGSFQTFCAAVLLEQGKSDADAKELADLMAKFYAVLATSDPSDINSQAEMNLILGAIDKIVGDLSTTTSSVNDTLAGIKDPAADVAGKLSSICDELDALYNFIDDAADLTNIGQNATKKAETILDQISALEKVLNAYEPKAQESLKTLEDLSVTAASSIRNAEKLITDTENLARTSGAQLDAGTKKTLAGLSSTLRKAAASLSTTGDIKKAKNNLDEIITDTWHEHTGDVDNLLKMDSTADAISLTSEKNPSPQSVQILIRSQEIKVPDEDQTEEEQAGADKGTFLSRVGQMFKDFWSAITGIFH